MKFYHLLKTKVKLHANETNVFLSFHYFLLCRYTRAFIHMCTVCFGHIPAALLYKAPPPLQPKPITSTFTSPVRVIFMYLQSPGPTNEKNMQQSFWG